MRLFVTGGTGFVGGHFIEQAMAAGHVVTALRRPGSAARRPLAAQPQWVEGSLEDDFGALWARQDVLVHLAAHTANPPYADLPTCLRWNVLAPLALAEQARRGGVQRFVVAGSCFEYGHAAGEAVRPQDKLAPNNAYASSKAAASVAFLGWAREHRLQLQLLRIFHVFGEGEPERRFWPALRRAALAGEDFPMSPGEQLRDFVPVEEAARQFVAALDFDDVPAGRPRQAHVATWQPQSLLAFARHWWQAWGATGQLQPGALPYRAGESMRLVAGRQDGQSGSRSCGSP